MRFSFRFRKSFGVVAVGWPSRDCYPSVKIVQFVPNYRPAEHNHELLDIDGASIPRHRQSIVERRLRTRRFERWFSMLRAVFTPNLQRHVSCAPRDVAGSTVREALVAACADQPKLFGYVLDGQLPSAVS